MTDFTPTIGRWWASTTPNRQAAGYLTPGEEDVGDWRLAIDGELADDTPPGFDTHITIHGSTPQGKYTLLRASTGTLRAGETRSQEWRGWELIHGGHITPNQRFTQISFRLPSLWHWIGPSRLNYHRPYDRFRWKPDDDRIWLTAHLDNALELRLGPTYHRSTGETGEAWSGYGVYILDRPEGVRLDEYETVDLALARLHAILLAEPMHTFDVHLLSSMGSMSPQLRILDPDPPKAPVRVSSQLHDPFMDTAEINFGTFMQAWLRMNDQALMALAAAAPRDDHQYISSKLIDTCNGIESLSAHLWPRPALQPADEAIIELLRQQRVCTSDTRRYIKSQLQARRWTLEDKLIQVVGLLGPESAAWLLGDSIKDWAHLVARLRNSLAHGSRLRGGLSDDLPFIVAAYHSAVAVLRLALLRHAGYTNPLSHAPGELLYAGDRKTVGHPNSRLYQELTEVARNAPNWPQWRARLTHTS